MELALEPALLGDELVETDEPIGLRVEEGETVLVGSVKGVDEDGIVCMDLGCGSIDVEVVGRAPLLGHRYRLSARALTAFDRNL